MRVNAIALAFALVLMSSLVALAEPPDRTVWRVGVFDGSSGEFASGDPQAPVHFVAGHDQPRPAWYAFAPVAWPGNLADSKSAPREIDFSTAGAPAAAYRLRTSLLVGHSSVRALRVGINGRSGVFYLHPRLVHAPLLSMSKIIATDAVERDQKPIVLEDTHTFKVAVRPHQIVTVRLIL